MAQQLREASARLALLRRREVEARTGLARSTIYALQADGKFPKAVHIGGSASVAWVESEIEAWIAEQIKASRKVAV